MSHRALCNIVIFALAFAVGYEIEGNLTRTASSTRTGVLVEVFALEGCSSWLSADGVLAQLVEQQPVDVADVIAISEHVDYWNQLGGPILSRLLSLRPGRTNMPERSDTLKSIRRRWWLTVRLNSFYCLAGIDQSDWIPRLKAASDPAKEFLFLPERKPAEERWRGFRVFLPGQKFPAR